MPPAAPAPQGPYAALEARFRRMGALSDALGILNWDSAVMMPDGAAPSRAETVATLSALHHEMLTDPGLGDDLAAAEAEAEAGSEAAGLSPWQRANLREMARAWRHATAVPTALVEAASRAASACERVWRAARPASDFAAVRPHLEAVLAVQRDIAAAKGEALGLDPYDALLDQYEPDGRAAAIEPLFADLAAFLPDFLAAVLARQAADPAPPPPAGPFPQAAQEAAGRRFMTALGFDFAHGRLDVSAHPFCGGSPDDLRLTTRYSEDDFSGALMGVLHETGHALYERGLPAEWRGQPVGQARGMSLHESQSLLFEMQACRSPAFFTFAAPILRAAFGVTADDDPAWSPAALHRRAITVRPGFIRVDADEVTYPAHVILRFRLERAMIAGDLAVADLPQAWNEGFKALLGLEVPEDRLGCLQDIHWYDGAFGYFPTYTLGAIAAAQLFAAARAARPDLMAEIAGGDFTGLLGWLRAAVHGLGASQSTAAILTHATGRPLDVGAFKAHLRARYLD